MPSHERATLSTPPSTVIETRQASPRQGLAVQQMQPRRAPARQPTSAFCPSSFNDRLVQAVAKDGNEMEQKKTITNCGQSLSMTKQCPPDIRRFACRTLAEAQRGSDAPSRKGEVRYLEFRQHLILPHHERSSRLLLLPNLHPLFPSRPPWKHHLVTTSRQPIIPCFSSSVPSTVELSSDPETRPFLSSRRCGRLPARPRT